MELLTGKVKEDFKEYVLENTSYFIEEIEHLFHTSDKFIQIYLNALIIDFFDSVGIYIGVEHYFLAENKTVRFRYVISNDFEILYLENGFEKRQEATTEAIKKACEIYNNKK